MNYYVCIYSVKDKNNKRYIGIYGYITSLAEKERKWINKKIDNKLKLYNLTSILNESDYNKFILEEKNNLAFGEDYTLNIGDIVRDSLISGINYNHKENKPTNILCDLKEYWNLDKGALIEDIKKIYQRTSKDENYIDSRIIELFNVVEKETAVNFINEPYRLGNLEVYIPKNHGEIFKIELMGGGKIIRVYVDEPLNQDVFIKLYSENNNRCIINSLKVLKKGERDINYNLNEDTFHILLEVWNKSGLPFHYQRANGTM